jgi:hypothetical protein
MSPLGRRSGEGCMPLITPHHTLLADLPSYHDFEIIDRIIMCQIKLTRSKCMGGFTSRCGLDVALAGSLEASVFRQCGETMGKKYLQKCRRLQFNLSKNVELRDRLVSEEIAVDELVQWGVEQLATAAVTQKRAGEEKCHVLTRSNRIICYCGVLNMHAVLKREWIAASAGAPPGFGGRAIAGIFKCPRCGAVDWCHHHFSKRL